jgi:hypothetical protein
VERAGVPNVLYTQCISYVLTILPVYSIYNMHQVANTNTLGSSMLRRHDLMKAMGNVHQVANTNTLGSSILRRHDLMKAMGNAHQDGRTDVTSLFQLHPQSFLLQSLTWFNVPIF